MPDLSKVVQHDGKIYCWDKQKKEPIILHLESVPIEKLPAEVIKQMIEKKD